MKRVAEKVVFALTILGENAWFKGLKGQCYETFYFRFLS
jgi:hypothetical protein